MDRCIGSLLMIFGIVAAEGNFPVKMVPDSYIAQASGRACVGLSQKIDEIKTQMLGDGVVGRQPPSREFQIHKACFVNFKGTKELSAAVEGMEGVDLVAQDMYLSALQANPTWGLDRIDQETLPLDNGIFSTEFTGQGVSVYIIDTGVFVEHLEFTERAEFLIDTTPEGTLIDGNGHGTHCAGTAVGRTYGVAKEANVFGVKVLTSSGGGTIESVIAGIEFAANHAGDKSAVISMSLGGGSAQILDNAVTEASDAGHIVTVAAGNSNADACSFSPAGAGGNGTIGGVITVGSTDSFDFRSSFSNYGSCVDIFAPGSDITSSWIGGDFALNTISGTSMATPHVAGVAATLLEKHNFDKEAAITELFESTAVGVINDVRGTPNRLLQVTPGDGTTFPPIETQSPTFSPTVTPGSPTNAPTSPWTCPPSWFAGFDGCDCECGQYDPDCDSQEDILFCDGFFAPPFWICDYETDTCIPPNNMTEAPSPDPTNYTEAPSPDPTNYTEAPSATPSNTDAPSAPQVAPPSWECPASWFGASDGCDCECGGVGEFADPDCLTDYFILYCGGVYEPSPNITCDVEIDECVFQPNATFGSTRPELSLPDKEMDTNDQENLSTSLSTAAIVGVVAFVGIFIVVAVTIKMRRSVQEKEHSKRAESLSVVGTPPEFL